MQAFQDLRGRVLYLVHNSTFDLAFHTWRDPLDRVAALAEAKRHDAGHAGDRRGADASASRARNVLWWKGLK